LRIFPDFTTELKKKIKACFGPQSWAIAHAQRRYCIHFHDAKGFQNYLQVIRLAQKAIESK